MNKIHNYLAIEDLGGPHFHPSENRIVFTYNASGVYQVYESNIEENKKLWANRMTFDHNRCSASRYLSDGSIIFVKDEGGDENFQIGMLLNGEQFWISDDKKAKFVINASSEKFLYFSSNTEDKSKFCIYRQGIPLLQHKVEKIFTPDDGIVSVSTISGDDSKIIIENYRSNTHSNLIMIDFSSGKSTCLTCSYDPSIWNVVRFLDDNNLIVTTNYNYDFKRPGLLSLKDLSFKPYKKLEKLNVEFNNATYKKGSSSTFMLVNNHGYSEIYECKFIIDKVEISKIKITDKGVILSGDQRSYTQSMSINHDGTMLAFNLSKSNYPCNIFIINLHSNNIWQATSTSYPGLNRDNFVDATLNSFSSFDDLEVPYFKYIPQSKKPDLGYSAILMIHGGPEGQYLPSFSPIVQFFLYAGFAVIAPNIRGSAGYGKNYMDLDNKDKRLDSILDIKYLALSLNKDDDINTAQLIIYGGSYGGFAVLSAMTEHPELWIAGVDIVGISDFVTFLRNTAPWRRKLRESEYGSLDNDYEMLRSISPIHKIDKISSPLFIIQGDNDERVPLSESIQMYEKLRESGINAELMRFDDEGHGIVKLKNKIIAYSRVIEWLDEIIKNE